MTIELQLWIASCREIDTAIGINSFNSHTFIANTNKNTIVFVETVKTLRFCFIGTKAYGQKSIGNAAGNIYRC